MAEAPSGLISNWSKTVELESNPVDTTVTDTVSRPPSTSSVTTSPSRLSRPTTSTVAVSRRDASKAMSICRSDSTAPLTTQNEPEPSVEPVNNPAVTSGGLPSDEELEVAPKNTKMVDKYRVCY